jgi:ribosomal protein L3 glutamine methyltransferase
MRTVSQWIDWAARQLSEANLHFGHGTDNARDEAAWTVLHAIEAPLNGTFEDWRQAVPDDRADYIEWLVRSRIERRCPMAYITGTAWFGGLEFEVGPEVLVPRSPIAELIAEGLQPWVDPVVANSILDLGTGCGCIASACALQFPGATVVGSDVSDSALAIARRNAARHGVEDRVRLIASDLFDSLGSGKYDVIVSNPPYVSQESLKSLPAEYGAEPTLGLLSGMDGLEIPLRILAQAGSHLTKSGVLVCEVGESQDRLQEALPEVPFLWLEFASGGGGVFLLEKAQVEEAGVAASRLVEGA